MSLDIEFDCSARLASFRARVVLFRRHSDKPTSVYFIIGPKEIQSITHSIPPQPSEADAVVKRDAVCLTFRLRGPATFVVPPDPLRLNDKHQSAILKLAASAARQDALSIYLQTGLLSTAQLTALCDATYQSFDLSSRYTELDTFYGGRGGKVVEPAAIGDAPAESPPSYNELGPPPPMPPSLDGKSSHLCMSHAMTEADYPAKTRLQPRLPRSVG